MSLSLDTWCTVFDILRDLCIENVRILKGSGIQVGNPTTYGEITPKFVHQIIEEVRISEDDIFYDIGSGIGNVVLQVGAQVGCQSTGIEIRPELTTIANKMKENLPSILQREHNKEISTDHIHFYSGDALSDDFDFSDATIIFLNNWCFGGELEHDLFVKFEKVLKEGTRIICLKDAFPRFRPNSLRFSDSPCQRFRYPWRKFTSCDEAISWDSRLVECVVYEVHDYGCTLQQANALINTLTISDCTFSVKPKSRPLFIDEAKAFVKKLLSENFVSPNENEAPWSDSLSSTDLKRFEDDLRRQVFFSTYYNPLAESDSLSTSPQLLPVPTGPRKIELILHPAEKKKRKWSKSELLSISDYDNGYEEQRKLHQNVTTKEYSNLFLRRNINRAHKRKRNSYVLFSFTRRPFGPEDEEAESVLVRYRSSPSVPCIREYIKNNKPRLKPGLKPNWKREMKTNVPLLMRLPNVKSNHYSYKNGTTAPLIQRATNVNATELAKILVPKSSSLPTVATLNTVLLSPESFRALRGNSLRKTIKKKKTTSIKRRQTRSVSKMANTPPHTVLTQTTITWSQIQIPRQDSTIATTPELPKNHTNQNVEDSGSSPAPIPFLISPKGPKKKRPNISKKKSKTNLTPRKSPRVRVVVPPRSAMPLSVVSKIVSPRPKKKKLKTTVATNRPAVFLRRNLCRNRRKSLPYGAQTRKKSHSIPRRPSSVPKASRRSCRVHKAPSRLDL